MIRKLEVLGLTLVAVFAISVVVASAANAEFTTTNDADLTAVDNGSLKFTVTGQTITCSSIVFTGTAPGASSPSIALAPTFTGCTTTLGTTMTVTGTGQHGESNKCVFTLHTDGLVDIHCDASADLTMDAGPCVVHIPEQTGLGAIKYTTGIAGTRHDLTLDFNVKNITATHTDGFLCPFGSGGESTGMEIHGEVTVRAAVNGDPVDLTHDLFP